MPAFAGYELVSLARLLTLTVKAGYLRHFAVTNCLFEANCSSPPYVLTITLAPRFPTVWFGINHAPG
jgi:hypothetical protein